jgi:hypothetical protein
MYLRACEQSNFFRVCASTAENALSVSSLRTRKHMFVDVPLDGTLAVEQNLAESERASNVLGTSQDQIDPTLPHLPVLESGLT